jgi:hypothetical protein
MVRMPQAISLSIPISNTIPHEPHLPSMATTTMDEGELPTLDECHIQHLE